MSDTYTIKGGASATWGTGTDLTQGTILDSNVEDTGEFEKIPNNQGATIGIVIFDEETRVTCEVLAKSDATKPAIGVKMTIETVEGTVLASSYKANHRATRKINITLHKWKNLTLAT